MFEWNENNFNIDFNSFVKTAYEAGFYAFVSDYVRLYALYNYGGIYMDTDVFVLKNFYKHITTPFLPLEQSSSITTVCMCFHKRDPLIKKALQYYSGKTFSLSRTNKPNIFVGPIFTRYFISKGLIDDDITQKIEGYTIFSTEYFVPKRWNWDYSKHYRSFKTFAIHLFESSWKNNKQYSYKTRIYRLISIFLGLRFANFIKRIITKLH